MKVTTLFVKPLAQVKRYHWRLMSEYVRRRDNGQCFTCNSHHEWNEMEAGHFIHSGNTENFWLDSCLDNIHCQCTGCNHYKSGNGIIYNDRMIARYGTRKVNRIKKLKSKDTNVTHDIVIKEIIKLKLLLQTLNDQGNNCVS